MPEESKAGKTAGNRSESRAKSKAGGRGKAPAKSRLTFEQAVGRLEEIVGLLESGEAPLDESLKLFREGAGLAAYCETTLKTAEQTVRELSGDAAGTSGPDAADGPQDADEPEA